jgi:ATP-dependent DNA ligase
MTRERLTLSVSFTVAPSREWRIEAPVAPAVPPVEAAVAPVERVAGKVGPEIVQLAVPYDPRHFPARGAIVERKHDGLRAVWIKGQLLTRNGLPMWNTAHLWPALNALEAAYGEAVVFDGEYVVNDRFGETAKEWNLHRNAGAPVDGRGVLYLFDAIPVPVWEGRDCGWPLIERKAHLRTVFMLAGDPSGLWPVDHWPVASDAAAQRLFNQAAAAGHEGIVIKDPRSLHYAGRGRAWQKLKAGLTLDLQVIGYVPRKDDPAMLGAIICDYQGRGVKVAAGFDDRTRATIMHHPERIAGRIAEIGCMEIMDSGQLRQAVFKDWRDDLGPGEIGLIRGRVDG